MFAQLKKERKKMQRKEEANQIISIIWHKIVLLMPVVSCEEEGRRKNENL